MLDLDDPAARENFRTRTKYLGVILLVQAVAAGFAGSRSATELFARISRGVAVAGLDVAWTVGAGMLLALAALAGAQLLRARESGRQLLCALLLLLAGAFALVALALASSALVGYPMQLRPGAGPVLISACAACLLLAFAREMARVRAFLRSPAARACFHG